MTIEYLNDAIVSVSPAAIEGWTYIRVDFNASVVLASGVVVTNLEILLDENGAAL